MKNLLLFLLFLTWSEFGFSSKHAIIIAVGDYPEQSGWSDISSQNDVALINDALLHQGFKKSNIKVLLDEKATKQGIIIQLDSISKNVTNGDVVVIHFSGHGQQITDNENADEIDGFDESLIPYDAFLNSRAGYNGENHLRDDEVNILIKNIQSKLGKDGNIFIILDSCHSGTATRGFTKSRGTSSPFIIPGPSSRGNKATDDKSSCLLDSYSDNNMASLVVISGAAQDELNYEFFDQQNDVRYGSLSYAISKVLKDAKPETTYRALFDLVKVEMSIIAPRQSPQIEGDIDEKIFGGGAVEQQSYFTIKSWESNSLVTINAGNLMGLYNGTKVGFFNVNTSDIKDLTPKITGTIQNSTAIESEITLDGSLSQDEAKNSWVFVTEKNYGDLSIKVQLGKLKNKELEKALINSCNSVPSITLVNKNPELIIEYTQKRNSDTLQIITADELQLFQTSNDDDDYIEMAFRITEQLKNYCQVKLIKSIDLKDESLDVTFEIIPYSIKKVNGSETLGDPVPIDTKITDGGQLKFTTNDAFKLKIKNNSYSKAYFQILDLQPNNAISILIPKDGINPQDMVIGPTDEKILNSTFKFTEPYGNETFKLIATREPLNLSMIVNTRGANTRSNRSPFEQLFAESYTQTRAASFGVPPASANVYSIPFKVVE